MASFGRSNAVIAGGIMVSRVTGLVRNMVLVAAISQVGFASDAFSAAMQVPSNVYTLISTGVLTAVIVPQIVRWSSRDDGGTSHIAKLFTVAAVVLTAATAIAIALAVPIVAIYAPLLSPDAHALAVAIAVWCLPQILFYGLFAVLGETLNARGVYGPYAWAPIVNNVVSIAGFAVFIVIFGSERSDLADWQTADGSWNTAMIATLAGSATIATAIQTGVLAVFWRKTGLSLRLDFSWRGIGLRHIARLAGWTFLMTVVGQLAGIVQAFPITAASGEASVTASNNAWLLFMLPYSVIVISLGTPLFTRISERVSSGQQEDLRADITSAIRVLGLLCAGASAVLIGASVPAMGIFAGSGDIAATTAPVLVAFAFGLVPLAVLFVVQRTFYAHGDTRTPFFFVLFQAAIAAGLALAAFALFGAPERIWLLTAAVACGQSIASAAQVVLASWLLKRKIGPFGMAEVTPSLLLFAVAAVVAAAAGFGVYLLAGGADGWMLANRFVSVAGAAVVAVCVGGVYIAILAALRVPELSDAMSMVRRMLGR